MSNEKPIACSASLNVFLDEKPLYYKEIDHERVHHAYAILKPYIRRPKTVHLVGTNGKGSTGRMIAYLAWKQGMDDEGPLQAGNNHSSFSVGHYTSPHILKFNERIWLNGKDASDELLEAAHQKLYAILGKEMSEALSYFEYTTLLSFVVLEKCDLMVLEAGLGGEFDATNVCDKELSVITPIGIDHQAFLGDTIEEISATKIRSIQKSVLLAPQPYDEAVKVAQQIAGEKKAELFSVQRSAFSVQKMALLHEIAVKKRWGEYLVDNAMVALQALEILGIPYDINDLYDLELFGRFYPLTENIRIDVGHNPLAAQAIVRSMQSETVLVYNSLDDKDCEAVLRILKPKVKRVEIILVDSQRAATLEKIERALQHAGVPYGSFNYEIDPNENYLVFGSFYTVEAFLKSIGFQK